MSRQRIHPPTLKRLLVYARPYRFILAQGVLCMLVVALATAASAKLMKPIIDDVFVAQDRAKLLPVTITVVALFFTKGLFSYLESVRMAHVGFRIITDLQKNLFAHLVHADLSFFQCRNSGDLVSRFITDINRLSNAVTGTITSISKDFLTLVFFIIVMFTEDAFLSVIVFGILPIAILPVVKIGRRTRKASTKVQIGTSDLHVMLTQAFQGIRVIKAYCLETVQKLLLRNTVEEVFDRTMKSVRTKAATHPLMEFLGGVAIAVVIMYGGYQVIEGAHTPGAFFTFITALIMSYEPAKRLANLSANLQEQLGAAERVFDLLDQQQCITSQPNAQELNVTEGQIVFEDVTFFYDSGAKDAFSLQDVLLELRPGTTTALVGPSGGGKSSLLNLVPRFYDPHEGKIMIDGQDIRQVTVGSLRSAISLVSQDIFLFDSDVYTNIACANSGACEADVIEAAKNADAHAFISALPQGYQSKIGEGGARLSGGQRQRLSIARAFLADAPILLLDEPTSALDTNTEERIQAALEKLAKGRTTLVIAHRLATIQKADKIVVMSQGQIVAEGTHQELITSCALYMDLCRKQKIETNA